jgi:hypothetical protein
MEEHLDIRRKSSKMDGLLVFSEEDSRYPVNHQIYLRSRGDTVGIPEGLKAQEGQDR